MAELEPMCDKQAQALDELHRALENTKALLAEAHKAQDEARAQMVVQNESNQALLEKLLAEQRATFEQVHGFPPQIRLVSGNYSRISRIYLIVGC